MNAEKIRNNLLFAAPLALGSIFILHGKWIAALVFPGGASRAAPPVLRDIPLYLILVATAILYAMLRGRGTRVVITAGTLLMVFSSVGVQILAHASSPLVFILQFYLFGVATFVVTVEHYLDQNLEAEFWKTFIDLVIRLIHYVVMLFIVGVALLQFFANAQSPRFDLLASLFYPTLVFLGSVGYVGYWLLIPAWEKLLKCYSADSDRVDELASIPIDLPEDRRVQATPKESSAKGVKLKDPNLAIALLALIVSVATLGYTVVNDRAEAREDVAVGIQEVLGDYQTEIQRGMGPAQPVRVAVAWEGLIANNGSMPVTIVGYELRQLAPTEMYYTGLDMGLTDVAGNRLSFPLSIDPGKAAAFHIRTGVLVDSQTYNRVAARYPLGSKPQYRTLVKALARSGTDLYGNPVEYRELTPGSVSIAGPSLGDSTTVRPSYMVILRTARKSVVGDVFSPYDLLGRW